MVVFVCVFNLCFDPNHYFLQPSASNSLQASMQIQAAAAILLLYVLPPWEQTQKSKPNGSRDSIRKPDQQKLFRVKREDNIGKTHTSASNY